MRGLALFSPRLVESPSTQPAFQDLLTAQAERHHVATTYLYSANEASLPPSPLRDGGRFSLPPLPIAGPGRGQLGISVRRAALALDRIADGDRTQPEVEGLIRRVREYVALQGCLHAARRSR